VKPAEYRAADHRRILVVDDEPQITRVLRTSLDAHGYDLRVANDGDTALQIARDWTPDLMITDLSMPMMDGLELCRRFRQKSNVPIIVLSVKGEERTKVQALDAGADDAAGACAGELKACSARREQSGSD
jgi:two-component system KDP operon response regulator KdpE